MIFHLKLEKNEILGNFGKSGSGKTTLLNIISSLLEPEKGDIFIDEIKLNNKQYNSYKKNIAFVTQSTMVFNDTIEKKHNLYDHELNRENLVKSIQLSGLEALLKVCPKVYRQRLEKTDQKLVAVNCKNFNCKGNL